MRSVLVLDLGSQYTHLIARRIRGLGVYSVVHPYDLPLSEVVKLKPYGVVLSGGPASVYESFSPKVDDGLFDAKIPLLGICYGMQLMVHALGGRVEASGVREYGPKLVRITDPKSALYGKVARANLRVWMSHGDRIESRPKGFEVTGRTSHATASIENRAKKLYAVQYHPEVVHTEEGERILANFVFGVCKARKGWRVSSFVGEVERDLRKRVGKRRVVVALSGGVDSTVMAALLHRVLGRRLLCVFIDNGLLRLGEANEVEGAFKQAFPELPFKSVDASARFLDGLRSIKNPEEKRRVIGRIFVEVLMEHVKRGDLLAQGTLYPDVIESVSTKGPSHTIKTHHNRAREVLDLMKAGRVVEPFRELFKDEVRRIGLELNVPKSMLERHPFPGPGLAVRVLGAVTPKKLSVLRHADAIFTEEMRKSALYSKIWQGFVVLLPVKSVGVMGDRRTYKHAVVLRAITSQDGMTADMFPFSPNFLRRVSSRIIGEVAGINRVTYDISTKPPATIEWE